MSVYASLHGSIDQVLLDVTAHDPPVVESAGHVTVEVCMKLDEIAARKLRDELSQVLGEMTRRRRRREMGGR